MQYGVHMPKENQHDIEILDEALLAIHRETGIRLDVIEKKVQHRNFEIDAELRLYPEGKTLFAEIKKWAPQANLGVLINRVRGFPGEGILIADYVNPNMAERLRQEKIQYIDTAGNAYIHQPGQFVYIKGNPAPKVQHRKEKDTARRAFEPRGLEVVYAFLCHEWLLNEPCRTLVEEPYRTIADRAGVAVGTVGWVINALKAGGFIRKTDWGNKRKLVNHEKLLERWVEAWPEKLKPKLHLGEFVTEEPFWWENIDITKYDGYWGGEVAAAKYVNYLRPEAATIYIPKARLPELLREARLQKADGWGGANTYQVHIYQRFWRKTTEYLDNGYDEEQGLAHPILTYADLIATGETRNLETAKKLYEQHIARQFIPED